MPSRTARFFALIALGTGLTFAQGPTATIMGTVKDASGAVLQGAAVSVRHVGTGLTRAVVTDASGSYRVPSLPVGATTSLRKSRDSRWNCCAVLTW
jgi:Carboxypeptidase regulatory-like domain